MRTKITFYFINFFIASLLLSCSTKHINQVDLNQNWQFRQDGKTEWLPAFIPGCVHTDLLANSKIDDPFFGDNEQKLQWIGKKNWEYKCVFNAEEILTNQQIDLVFKGLDTWADVYLNDSLILKADNMFREWRINCRNLLKPEGNSLLIKFTSPEYMDSVKASELPYKLPDDRAFTRKAPYQFGWDWGPKFVTCGIWKPVFLHGWNSVKITDVRVATVKIDSSRAHVSLRAEIESTAKQQASINYRVDKINKTVKIALEKGSNIFIAEIFIPKPRLWWPNGMGDHPLYTLNLTLNKDHHLDSDSSKVRFGIRMVELVRENDSIGQSFYFKINDIPFFAKGANYIPQDNFPTRVSDEKYRANHSKCGGCQHEHVAGMGWRYL